MKEKIICVIKNNLDSFYLRDECFYSKLNFEPAMGVIKQPKFEVKPVVKTYKTWWGKTKKKTEEKSFINGYEYRTYAFGKYYDLTKKEYDDIMTSFEEYKESEQMEVLNKLCEK